MLPHRPGQHQADAFKYLLLENFWGRGWREEGKGWQERGSRKWEGIFLNGYSIPARGGGSEEGSHHAAPIGGSLYRSKLEIRVVEAFPWGGPPGVSGKRRKAAHYPSPCHELGGALGLPPHPQHLHSFCFSLVPQPQLQCAPQVYHTF